jgi:hypothetical protein
MPNNKLEKAIEEAVNLPPMDFCGVMCKFSQDIINRLQAENERLERVVEYTQGIIDVLFTDNAKLLAKQSGIQATETTNMLRDMEFALETTKTEAYKEFAEKIEGRIAVTILKGKSDEYADGFVDALDGVNGEVDNLLKELVGEDK